MSLWNIQTHLNSTECVLSGQLRTIFLFVFSKNFADDMAFIRIQMGIGIFLCPIIQRSFEALLAYWVKL